jgi:formylmethanofuran dehydrogenase subunit E
MAATFCDIQGNRAVRLVALDSAKNRAMQMYPELQNKNLQQMKVYRELPDEDLFAAQWVRVRLDSEDLPGYKKPEALCSQCGESIQFGREILREGIVLCRACAGQRYYDFL